MSGQDKQFKIAEAESDLRVAIVNVMQKHELEPLEAYTLLHSLVIDYHQCMLVVGLDRVIDEILHTVDGVVVTKGGVS